MRHLGILCNEREATGLYHGNIRVLRRPLDPQPVYQKNDKKLYGYWVLRFPDGSYTSWEEDLHSLAGFEGELCPYGEPGEHVWIKEPWWHRKTTEIEAAAFVGGAVTRKNRTKGYSYHRNDGFYPPAYQDVWSKKTATKMPKWAARQHFEVVNVKVSRVRQTTVDQAVLEGADGRYANMVDGKMIRCSEQGGIPVLDQHRRFWDAGHASKNSGLAYENSPWGWVITLE